MSDWSPQDWGIFFAVATPFIAGLAAAVVLIIKALREGQDKATAASAIYAEQKNRELAVLGATPVTNQSPPMGTGDGRVDAQVSSQLASGPTTPGTVPDPAVTPLVTPKR